MSGGLETLAELAERLTVRLLELEERLGEQETLLSSLQMGLEENSKDLGAAFKDKMVETEDRLARIERLLQGEGQSPLFQKPLRALPNRRTKRRNIESPEENSTEETTFQDHIEGAPFGEQALPMEEGPVSKESPLQRKDFTRQSLAS